MRIKRDKYLNMLIDAKWNGLIKIVTGIRRCGKSYLLGELFYEHLINSGICSDHIIKIALDDEENKDLRDASALSLAINKQTSNKEVKYYLIIDEIQKCIGFEDVLNGILYKKHIDIYVTGSNSKFLSKDVITEFRGRGLEINLLPLSFSEILPLYDNPSKALANYLLYGGMPIMLTFNDDQGKRNYLSNLFKTVYLSDIIERYNIEHADALERIIDLLSSSIGSLTNPNKITNTLSSKGQKGIDYKTVKNYLDYITDAYLFEKVDRYDVKGKKYFETISKYYATDLGLRNARLNFRQYEENHLMENAIYLELLNRGFSVDVGIVEIREVVEGKRVSKQLEIDFIANKSDKRYYIQSAYQMPTEEKRNQEIRPFRAVDDSFKKILIVRNDFAPIFNDENGILHIGLLDFLSDPNSLNRS
ncbi:MAG: ATP-binding protein [Acholeplasmataceae bacterium]|nr:ATP-binding protein [Acholeplasmataceae bacterium]